MQQGEALEQALRREMFEETSLELRSALFLCQAEGSPVCVFYVCEMQPGEPQLGGPEREDHAPTNPYILEWVPLDRITFLRQLFPSPLTTNSCGFWMRNARTVPVKKKDRRSQRSVVGCLDGFEPSTSSSTVRRSAVELQAPCFPRRYFITGPVLVQAFGGEARRPAPAEPSAGCARADL